ncbi:cysteine proteinase [Jackrogersella minutella]|nr:cysteine proteinase [Jackrogersella minutella]
MSAETLDDAAKLRRLQWVARQTLRIAHDADGLALTAPRFLRQFLASQLPMRDLHCDCASHELLEVKTQSYNTDSMMFVSLVCNRCRYHFHIKSDSRHVQQYNHPDHRHHMLVVCSQRSSSEPTTVESIYDDTVNSDRYICVAHECFFNVEISVVPWRISPVDISKFFDKSRIVRNLALAKAQDPDRYADWIDVPTPGSEGILRKYLTDALVVDHEQRRKINKRNKKFFVSMGSDFDNLLRFLGFEEGTDWANEDPCWFIPVPEKEQNPTKVGTLRARMEDAQVEIDILFTGAKTINAWEKLLQAFQGDYPNASTDLNYINSIPEKDLTTLGCLAGYLPEYLSWASILLAKLRPKDRDKYLDTGLRCISDREDAYVEIIMYKSRFDGASFMDIRVQEAYNFFNASLEGGLTSDWFLAKYYEMAKSYGDDDFKAQAQQHLEAIGSHLGRDIVSEIDPKVLGESGARMTVSAAAELLEVEPDWTAEIIRGFVERLIRKEDMDRDKVIEALAVLSDKRQKEDKPEEATELQQIADFVKATGSTSMSLTQVHSTQSTSMNTPPGLKNIGNTCYLNSLLQYFYNVKVVRDLVLNFDDVKLELDEQTVEQRRTGGNGTSVNLEEAIVARQFIEMLQGLFADLQTTKDAAAQPSQKLANTALSSARDILDQPSQNVPPPLPARPSPAPPALPKADSDEVNGVANSMVNVTVESVNEKLETASSQSSQTLVDETEDVVMSTDRPKTPDDNTSIVLQSNEDVTMQEAPEPWSLDAKVAEVSRRLEHSDRSGTSQQDVGEIIGNILEHFMRAIRSDGPMPDKPELQADKITETFFTTIVNYTIKTRKGYPTSNPVSNSEESPLNVEIVPERWITAYPEEVEQASEDASKTADKADNARCSLVSALDRYFSYETIDDGNRARYSSIRSLPPILHICIQRSTPKGKNKNPVTIPEILFMDRYMEAGKGSPVWIARKKTWAIKARLKDLGVMASQKTQAKPAVVVESPVGDSLVSKFKTMNMTNSQSKAFMNVDLQELKEMTSAALEKSRKHAPLEEAVFADLNLHQKCILPYDAPDSLESKLSEQIATPTSSIDDLLSDAFSDIMDETTEAAEAAIDEATQQEILHLRQMEETAFDAMTNEKYTIHAVICHRGGTTAGHYWVWIRDFKRNIWYRYNDETVTEDDRGTEAVLNDLNETGDPYYVAYVRDEMKDDLVDVPLRHKSVVEGSSTTGQEAGAVQEVEMIEGVAPDTTQVSITN